GSLGWLGAVWPERSGRLPYRYRRKWCGKYSRAVFTRIPRRRSTSVASAMRVPYPAPLELHRSSCGAGVRNARSRVIVSPVGARRAEPDGRIKAFEAFHREIGTDAARYAATILGPRRLDLLEDVLQESWASAWRSWDTSDPEHRSAWFFRIVRNACIDQHRKHVATDQLPPG